MRRRALRLLVVAAAVAWPSVPRRRRCPRPSSGRSRWTRRDASRSASTATSTRRLARTSATCASWTSAAATSPTWSTGRSGSASRRRAPRSATGAGPPTGRPPRSSTSAGDSPSAGCELRLSGDNFRRRVAVEGSETGAAWATLVDEAWVFAVPGEEPSRYETVDLPENDFPRLRVVVHPAPDERGAARDRGRVGARRRPAPAAARNGSSRGGREAQDAKTRETWLTLDLGARHQPFHAIELDVGGRALLSRGPRRGPARPADAGGAVWWEEIGRGALYRLEHDGRRRECLRLEARGRERALRVRVRNLDDRPLQVRGVAVRVPVERLLFEAEPPRALSPHLRLVRSDGAFLRSRAHGGGPRRVGRSGPAGRLGPPRRLAAGRDDEPPLDGAPPVAPVGRPSRGRRGAGGPHLRGAPPRRLKPQRGRAALALSQRRSRGRCGRPAARTGTRARLAQPLPRGDRGEGLGAGVEQAASSATARARHGDDRGVADATGGTKERGHDGPRPGLDRLAQVVEGDPAVERRERLVDRGARPKRGPSLPPPPGAGPAARGPSAAPGWPARRAGRGPLSSARRPPADRPGGRARPPAAPRRTASVRGRAGARGELRVGGRGEPLQQRPERGRGQRRVEGPQRVQDGQRAGSPPPARRGAARPAGRGPRRAPRPAGGRAPARGAPAAGGGRGAGQDARQGPGRPRLGTAAQRLNRAPGHGLVLVPDEVEERGRGWRGPRAGPAPRGRPAGPPGPRWGERRAERLEDAGPEQGQARHGGIALGGAPAEARRPSSSCMRRERDGTIGIDEAPRVLFSRARRRRARPGEPGRRRAGGRPAHPALGQGAPGRGDGQATRTARWASCSGPRSPSTGA